MYYPRRVPIPGNPVLQLQTAPRILGGGAITRLETPVPYTFEKRPSFRRTPPRETLTATPVTTEEIEIDSSPEEQARKRKRGKSEEKKPTRA